MMTALASGWDRAVANGRSRATSGPSSRALTAGGEERHGPTGGPDGLSVCAVRGGIPAPSGVHRVGGKTRAGRPRVQLLHLATPRHHLPALRYPDLSTPVDPRPGAQRVGLVLGRARGS